MELAVSPCDIDVGLGTWNPSSQKHEDSEHIKDVPKKLPVYKTVMVGASGVGKSALTIQMTHQRFMEDYDPTIQDSYWKEVALDSGVCILNVLDTSGQDIYRVLRNQCLAAGDGILAVFALDDLSSLDQLQQILAASGPDHTQPFILVGNKCDLATDARDVYVSAATLAQSWGIPFVETSAKTRQGVEEAFSMLIQEIQRVQASMEEAGGKKAHHQKVMCSCGCSVA